MSDEETVALTVRLAKEQHERLRRTAFTVRRPISELIREAVDKTHFHATGIWCDECPPEYRVPPMSGPNARKPSAPVQTAAEAYREGATALWHVFLRLPNTPSPLGDYVQRRHRDLNEKAAALAQDREAGSS